MGFPGGSDSKESACNVRDLGSIPGSGRSPGEGTSSPLQYSWVSLVAQVVKSPPTMWKTWVQYLGWEDPLEEGRETHSSILHGLQPTRLLHPWDFPGKSTGVGCHCLLRSTGQIHANSKLMGSNERYSEFLRSQGFREGEALCSKKGQRGSHSRKHLD